MKSGYSLMPGHESTACVELLLQMCNIRSENKRDALLDHLVTGSAQTTCALIHDIGQSTIADALKRLNHAHSQALHYQELYSSNS